MATQNPANVPSETRRSLPNQDRPLESGQTVQGDMATRLYPRTPEITARRPDPIGSEAMQSTVDRTTAITGKISTEGDLIIEGALEGNLDCQGKLFIAEGARVDAHIRARSIVVAGELRGEAICDERLELLSTARVSGFLKTSSLIIHEGARMDGRISMTSDGSTASGDLEPGPILELEPVGKSASLGA